MYLLEELDKALVAQGFTKAVIDEADDPRESSYLKWNNFGFFDKGQRRNLFLVVKLYDNDDFINVWIDKLWDNESMSNGFIHLSVRAEHDVHLVMLITSLAM